MNPIDTRLQASPVPRPQPLPAQREAIQSLARSLRAGDLDGARQAFVDVVRNAPEGARWNPDSAFAALGRALQEGDLEAAREAARKAAAEGLGKLRDVRSPTEPGTPLPIAAQATTASTGGMAGTTLNVVA